MGQAEKPCPSPGPHGLAEGSGERPSCTTEKVGRWQACRLGWGCACSRLALGATAGQEGGREGCWLIPQSPCGAA